MLSCQKFISSLVVSLCAAGANAQLSSSAYRVLGQPNLNQSGLNLVQGVELNSPGGIALDTRGAQTHVYIADTQNSRILAWADVNSYQAGNPPALVLGQTSPVITVALGIGTKGMNAPLGLAVDANTGNLYVADYGDNRVLGFASPFDNPTVVEPNTVYGQPGFTTRSAGTAATALNGPRAVAVDGAGNLWVSDTGNNRLLRFPAANLSAPAPVSADTVIGQSTFLTSAANAGGAVSGSGFDQPLGITLDAQGNLYVADFNNTRVLEFNAPLGPSNTSFTANLAWGQTGLTTRGVPSTATSSSIQGPYGVAVDGNGNLYVGVPLDNRILVFPSAGPSGAAAKSVIGQGDFVTTTANTGTFPQSSANTLSGPSDVKVDGSGNLLAADTGNNRVLWYAAGSKTASKVWGQSDFVSNGANQVKPASVNFPFQIAIDYSQQPFAMYVSDTGNNRVLIWKDSAHFTSGQAADLVIGQPNLNTAAPNIDTRTGQTPTSTSLSAPTGIAVAADGTLYVADSGNNRVLRYPRPVAQNGRITPSAVIGQANFTSATSAAISATSLKTPGGLAIGPNGNLFVADSGNNRVLEFAGGPGTNAAAIRVYGQASMNVAVHPTQISAQTLIAPQGLFVDGAANLYVADSGANRVLVFPNTGSAPAAGAVPATVLGQADFNGTAGGTALRTPFGVGVDSGGNVYVSDTNDNRVVKFGWPLSNGAAAVSVIGQNGGGTSANWDTSNGMATADSLYNPVAVFLDRQDTLYVGDAGNSRVAQFLKQAVVYHSATLQTGVPIAIGSIASLFGAAVAGSTALVNTENWPSQLVNRQIVVNDQLVAPMYYAAQTQINFQLPYETPLGQQRVAVRTADTNELIAGGTVIASAVAPGIFTLTETGSGQAAVLNQDYTINGPSNPAAVGSTVSIFATGQGQVSPTPADGSAALSQPLSYTVAVPTANGQTCFALQPSVCVAIGSAFGAIQYSGLAPNEVGVWQINVTIPSGIVTGSAVGVRVVIDGAASNLVTIAVK